MQTYQDPDLNLVERIQSGDDAAFDELMLRYKRPVLNFVYRMLGDAVEAEDIAQEVFVRVYRNIGAYRPRTKFSTWLFALARNAAIDSYRSRKRHSTESIDSVPNLSASSSVVAEINAQEIGEQIARAVGALPEDQKTAIILSEYQGLSDAEIAGVMKCSVKSVESRLYRAKHALRASLKHLLD